MAVDHVLVRPGAKVPVEGNILEGASGFNEAMLTGESRPVSKGVGEPAIGGAINGATAVTIEVTATGGKTYLAQRSEEHTSAFQSLMRITYAVFCLNKQHHPLYYNY